MLSQLVLTVEMDIFKVFSGLLFSHLQNKQNCPNDYLFNPLFFFPNKFHFRPIDYLPSCSSKGVGPNSSFQ